MAPTKKFASIVPSGESSKASSAKLCGVKTEPLQTVFVWAATKSPRASEKRRWPARRQAETSNETVSGWDHQTRRQTGCQAGLAGPTDRSDHAADIAPFDIQRGLVALHNDKNLAWTIVSKIRGLMLRVYKIGLRHIYIDMNPVEHTECRSTTAYKAIIGHASANVRYSRHAFGKSAALCPRAHMRRNSPPFFGDSVAALVRHSVDKEKISVSKRWAKGSEGKTKTAASNSTVPLHTVLDKYRKQWHVQTPYPKHGDFDSHCSPN
jgi:hypothetical protein